MDRIVSQYSINNWKKKSTNPVMRVQLWTRNWNLRHLKAEKTKTQIHPIRKTHIKLKIKHLDVEEKPKNYNSRKINKHRPTNPVLTGDTLTRKTWDWNIPNREKYQKDELRSQTKTTSWWIKLSEYNTPHRNERTGK